MRRLLLVIISFVLAAFELSGQDIQGVKWESCGLDQALELASKSVDGRSMVFLDCYSQACPPCKMMLAKVFPTKEAGDYFNTRFINLKLDLSAPENAALAEKYDVSTFPTFLFLCPDGSELCRIVGATAASGATANSGNSVTPEQFIARVEHALDPANRIEVLLGNFNCTGNSEYLFQYLERLQKEGQYRRLRSYVINNYDALSAMPSSMPSSISSSISSSSPAVTSAIVPGCIVTDPRFWKYIKIAINLNDLTVLEKVLANKAEFDKTIGKAKVEKDLYNDLKYELSLYRRKGGNFPPSNIQRAGQVMQMFAPDGSGSSY